MQKNFKLHSALHGSLSQCPECGKKFSRFASLKAHILLHIEDDTLICQHCDNEFETLRALQYHVEEEHGPNKNMNLNSVNGLDNLSNCASNSGPPVTKQYSCKVCQKDFDSDKSLKEHAQYHKKVIWKTFFSSLTNISSFFFYRLTQFLQIFRQKRNLPAVELYQEHVTNVLIVQWSLTNQVYVLGMKGYTLENGLLRYLR